MGLPMVYGTVRRHGGDMMIKSELGKGTTISISLPVRQQATRLESPLSDEGTVEPMTILLVDDEPVVPEVMAALPTSEGHKVIQAKSGHEGLEAFQRETHDMVITDRAIPNMNGG